MQSPTACFGRLFFLAYVLVLLAPSVAAERLQFSFTDQAGDPRDNFDLTRIDFEFDNTTGDFWVTATATEDHPFDGSHLLYLSIYNPDADPEHSFFTISRFGFFTDVPTAVQQRQGNQQVLTGWSAGDRVASYDLFGSPSGSPFQSVLGGNLRLFSESDEIRDDAVIAQVPIPEPSSMALVFGCLVVGVLALAGRLASPRQLAA